MGHLNCGASAVNHGVFLLSFSIGQASWEFSAIGDVSLVVHPMPSSSPVVYFTLALSQASFEFYLARNLLAVCELGWIPVYTFHFQNMPSLSICVPGL